MLLLIFFAFIAGLVTILSPCIFPVLPIVLSGSVDGGKKRPLGIVTGFIVSFTFFTLLLSTIVKATGLPADGLRTIAVIIIAIFGFGFLVPSFQIILERIFTLLTQTVLTLDSRVRGNDKITSGNDKIMNEKINSRSEYVSGFFIGLSLGLVWAPCVGPILASVITLAATSSLNLSAFFITLAYSFGTAIPLLGITYGGRTLLQRAPWLLKNTVTIQKVFGMLMIITALAMYLNLDRIFQTYVLKKFPNYGVGLTKFEDIPIVKNALKQLTSKPMDEAKRGKPMNELVEENYPMAPEFIAGGEWINTPPLTMASLKGKVVLVDFWTYTCINCIRTFPYLKSWHEKYASQGLVIVGVHTPEFAFEKTTKNVERAIKDFGITYPVMQDNDYATWQAYNNHYWPAHYLIDKDGRIRDTHFGEGKYDETEQMIQTLLTEAGSTPTEIVHNPIYQVYGRTPETYLGYERMAGLTASQKITRSKIAQYSPPTTLSSNTFALGSGWNIDPEFAMPQKGATLTYNFNAKEVYLVMKPTKDGLTSIVRVSLDGIVVNTTNAGKDVKDGIITIDADRLYRLINVPAAGVHLLKIEFLDDNTSVFAFTFG